MLNSDTENTSPDKLLEKKMKLIIFHKHHWNLSQ